LSLLDRQPSEPVAAVSPRAAPTSLADAPLPAGSTAQAPRAEASIAAAPTRATEAVGSAAAARPERRRAVLRGSVSGTRTVPPEGLTLRVYAGLPARELKSAPIAGDGPFVLELGAELPDFDPTSGDTRDRVSVLLVGAGYVAAGVVARNVDEGRSGEHTLLAEITARPVVRAVRGHALTVAGEPLPIGHCVEFVTAGAARNEPTHVFPNTRCDKDGRFALELTEPDAGEVVLFAQGCGAVHIALGADQLGDVDLGELRLPAGAVITGRVATPGGALATAGPVATPAGAPLRGAVVLARAPLAPAAWNERALGFQALGGRVHDQLVRATVEHDGTFELRGLEPGLTYTLVLVPRRVAGEPAELIVEAPGGIEVTAPASGVTLAHTLAAVRVVVRQGDEPVEGATLCQVHPADDPLLGVPEALRRPVVQRAPRGEAVVLVPTGAPTRVRVSAPAVDAVEAVLDPSLLSVEAGAAHGLSVLGPVVVQLGAARAPAALEWRIDYPGPGSLDGAQLVVVVHSVAGAREVLGPAQIVAGRARFANAPVGSWLARPTLVCALDTLPYVLELFATADVTLRSGETTVVTRTLDVGGRVEVQLVGRDPALAPPEFVLLEANGNEVRPELLVADGAGHTSVTTIETDGPLALGRVVPAGVTYTVRQVGEAYMRSEHMVTVHAGRTTRIVVQLQRR